MIIDIKQNSNTNIIDFLTTRTFRSTSSPIYSLDKANEKVN